MLAGLNQPVPSYSLLRFLRAQCRVQTVTADTKHGLRRALPSRPRPASLSMRHTKLTSGGPAGLSRSFCISRPRGSAAVMQAGLFDFNNVIPKAFRRGAPAAGTNDASGFPGARRYTPPEHIPSVICRQTWADRLLGRSNGGSDSSFKAEDLKLQDDEDPATMFSPSRTHAAKAALEPRLRCTEVDEHGKVILADGEFKKSELIAKYGLLPRDLRKIDASNLPHILVRPSSILLNLLHLKVLIKFDRVLLFDVYGSTTSYPQSAFMYDLQGKLEQKQTPTVSGLPYEFRALEAVLTSVTTELEAEFDAVQAPVIRILSELEDDIDREKLRILLVLSKKVSTFEQKAKLVRDAIEELLEADDDLAAMYLTEKTHDLYRGEDDHTEIEMLLESYHKICDEVAQEAGNLVSSIRNTEEIIRAILDSNRNSLMLLDLKFSVGTLGLAMGTFIAGLYGMNLENFIEEKNWGFGTVTAISSVFSLVICWYGLTKLRKVQRVKMGESLRGPDQAYWYRDDPTGGLLDARNREKLRQINMRKAAVKRKRWF